MTIYGKVWGTTKPLIQNSSVEIHQVLINPKTKCSVHCHQFKWNAFYVISGELDIVVEKSNYSLTDRTPLKAGQFTTVKPGEYHWFENNGDSVVEALEIYYPEGLSEDIVRRTCGGTIDPANG